MKPIADQMRVANLMRPGMYGSYHHISVPRLENSPDFLKANVGWNPLRK